MGIGSYKEAQRYRMRTNKNLTRSFYLDTRRTLDEEPFAWETNVDPGMVVDPSKILPKNFTDDMPFVTDENNTEQLELANGGIVERQGFAPGGISKCTRRLYYR